MYLGNPRVLLNVQRDNLPNSEQSRLQICDISKIIAQFSGAVKSLGRCPVIDFSILAALDVTSVFGMYNDDHLFPCYILLTFNLDVLGTRLTPSAHCRN